jgi:hypothetical protein
VYPSITVNLSLAVVVVVTIPPPLPPSLLSDWILDNRLTIASCKILCIPKKRNIKKLSNIICCDDGRESSREDGGDGDVIVDVSEFLEFDIVVEEDDVSTSWYLHVDDDNGILVKEDIIDVLLLVVLR